MVKGLYVHIPFCGSKCGYCAFYSITGASAELQDSYIKALEAELNCTDIDLSALSTIYVGGGSPSFLSECNLEKLLQLLTKYGNIEEYTFELNPDQATEVKLGLLKTYGVNRLSFGAQSFSEKSRSVLCRNGSHKEIYLAFERAVSAGFENIGIDVITCVPGAGSEELLFDLQNAISLNPQHISCYGLTLEKGTALEMAVNSGKLTLHDEEQQREFYLLAHDVMESAGYKRYEVSNYSLPGFECRHNKIYWTGREYLGVGASACSFYGLTHRKNVEDVASYIASVHSGAACTLEKITDRDYLWQTAVVMLRLAEGINCSDFQRLTGSDFLSTFSESVEKNIASGFIVKSGGAFRLTDNGMLLADLISEDFVL